MTAFIAGCKDGVSDKGKSPEKPGEPPGAEAQIKANFAKMSDEDRPLAEAQKFCAVEPENKLGSMGMPLKVMLKDQAVFVCCKRCIKMAQADPDKTLTTVKDLKAKSGT